MVFVFSYNRQEMLLEVLSALSGEHFLVLDDGSDFDTENMIKFPHEGKAGFWKRWVYALEQARLSKDDFFMFMPDDFININLSVIKNIHQTLKSRPYVFNIINDGRTECWTGIAPSRGPIGSHRVGFADCGFFCNRAALSRIGFEIRKPPDIFLEGNLSSGVGYQLSRSFAKRGVPMYLPNKSLAYHGDHDSLMHPEERKINPLIST